MELHDQSPDLTIQNVKLFLRGPLEHILDATNRALNVCYSEARTRNIELLSEELTKLLNTPPGNEQEGNTAIANWAIKLATVEAGGVWREPLDIFLDQQDDGIESNKEQILKRE